jgi:hypothetical protein
MSFSVHCSSLGLSLPVLTDGVRDGLGGEAAGHEQGVEAVEEGGDGAEHAGDGVVGEVGAVPVESGADAHEELAQPERGDPLEVVDVEAVEGRPEGIRHEVEALGVVGEEREHNPPRVQRVLDLVRLYERL